MIRLGIVVMQMNNKLVLIALSLFSFIGCSGERAAHMGNNSYFINRQDDYLTTGASINNKADIYEEANNFCAKKGLKMKVINRTIIPTVQSRVGSTDLNFKCIKPDK